MLCERCGQREATVHQTMVTNGVKQESHLCVECAREIGAIPNFSFPNLSMQQLLSSFLGQTLPGTGAPKAQLKAEPTCRYCGMTYSQFAQAGVLGCPRCYQEMEQQLLPMIKRIQGTTTHSGKVPKRTGGIARKRRDLAALRAQLQSAVQGERYEEAARLRDQIRALEAEIAAGGEDRGME
ncbi:protein arginine kinase activator [Symbiobacterium terraclitae]|uniref:Protein arginine kinase activator n=1 Tax=Symbiobacterium terraclitae TaxID=557451 RepID=A0ABS4JTQ0_9FIRM|nr:UvrB/UvrC motif-containing protein [Symbiobacterium terraclitae]MBP2018366.1 protein arginine kinase activator [Symbiobacterium terraclitae]